MFGKSAGRGIDAGLVAALSEWARDTRRIRPVPLGAFVRSNSTHRTPRKDPPAALVIDRPAPTEHGHDGGKRRDLFRATLLQVRRLWRTLPLAGLATHRSVDADNTNRTSAAGRAGRRHGREKYTRLVASGNP